MSILTRLVDLYKKYEVTEADIQKAIRYLQYYGYLDEGVTVESVIKAVKIFQKVYGLVVDGEIGPKTLRAFDKPRCGCKDTNIKLYVEQLSKWGTKNLKYYIGRRDTDLSANIWDSIIEQAFLSWSAVANLSFTRVDSQNQAHLVIDIGSGSSQGFDGPNGILAWAQLPPNSNFTGQLIMRFDTGEKWLDKPGNGILLLNVAAHEIGHLLGLEHSDKNTALMAPYYSASINKPQVSDDIPRIQALYGKNTNPTPNPEPNPEPNPVLQAPSDLTCEVSGNNILLTWKDNSTGEDKFEVYRNEEYLGFVSRGVTKATDVNVKDGVYSYKVRAVKGQDKSEFSNTFKIVKGNVDDGNDDGNNDGEDMEITLKITGKNIKVEFVE